MKLVQIPLTPLLAACCAALTALASLTNAEDSKGGASAVYFDPTKGFKPADTSLGLIFLQIAGSLEHYGSPAPYIRHLQAEEQRITAKYQAKTGEHPGRHRPASMDDVYLDQLIANWDLLSPRLGLDALAKQAGHSTREAIEGARGKGTTVSDILNQHQNAVAKGMEGGPKAGFEVLQAKLFKELAFDVPTPATGGKKPGQSHALATMAAQEIALTAAERGEYASLLSYRHFTKALFGEMDRFYKGAFDKLTEAGKEEISRRTMGGVRGTDADFTRIEAITAALRYRSEEATRFAKIDAAMPPNDAKPFRDTVQDAFITLGILAETELELGVLDSSLR